MVKRNVYLNLDYKVKSSWCIFTGASDPSAKDYTPIACSSGTFTFEEQDKSKIDNLRSWIRVYFNMTNSLVYGHEFKLGNRSQSSSGDNDVLVQIVHKKEFDDQVVYFIQDETDGCELHSHKYFNFFEVNDVIRVRSFKVADRNIVLMNKFSNLLKIPTFSDYYKEFINRLAKEIKVIDTKADAPVFEKKVEDVDAMIVDTHINWGVTALYDESKYKLKSINELTESDETFVLHVNIMSIFPENIADYVLIMCNKCQSSFSTNDIDEIKSNHKFICKNCKTLETGLLYYNAALRCRESNHANKIITLYLSTYDNEGAKFFGLPAVDLHRNHTQLNKLKTVVRKLSQPDASISVLVEAIKTGNSNSDRVYRIIGDYQNNFI